MTLSANEQALHSLAIRLAGIHRQVESRMIRVLKKVDRTQLFKKLGQPSLFKYAVECLKLTEPVAYSFCAVARSCLKVPELDRAIGEQKISVARASRIVSVLKSENAAELVQFAASQTSRAVEKEVARLSPRKSKRDSAKAVSEKHVRFAMTVSTETSEKLDRVKSLMATRGVKDLSGANVLDVVLDEYLDRHDPVRRAERAVARKEKAQEPAEFCVRRKSEPKRVLVTAEQKHTVFARDGGCCTHVNEHGVRCRSDRWLHIHHIIPVSRGGTNDPENLTTLCSFHHDLVHQLSLPIEGQISWIREPVKRYDFARAESTAHLGMILSRGYKAGSKH